MTRHNTFGSKDMNKTKLRKLLITLSVVAWFIFAAICLVPMSEGGLAAFACLVMVGVFTAIVALDIFGTLSLDKPRMGCHLVPRKRGTPRVRADVRG